MQAVRSSVLAHIRLRLAPWMQPQQQQPIFSIGARLFAAEAQEGSYLDKVDVTSRVLNLVKKMPDVEQAMVSPYSNFQKDLDMDSLDTIEVVMAVEEEFGIEIPYGDADKILTIQDAIDYITSQPQAK